MASCPRCGAIVNDTEKFCGSCGSPMPAVSARPAARSKRSGRGLNIAIAVVAILCVVTAGLWIAWPHLRSSTVNAGQADPYISVQSTPVTQVAATPAVSTLKVGSWWHGSLRVRNYQGSGELNADQAEVWAYLGMSSDGKAYFEIYDRDHVDESTSVLLSCYVDLYTDHFVPMIGEDDAWFFDIYLDQRDVGPLTVYLRNGALDFSYAYHSSEETCDIEVHLDPK